MRNIEVLATQFRDAIEAAWDAGEFERKDRLSGFPRGCCDDASDLLAQFLLDNGIRTRIIYGTHRDGSFEIRCLMHG